MGIWLATREDVKRALDVAETARSNAQIGRAIGSASGRVEGQLHRKFRPRLATRYFDWPNHQYSRTWRLWLDDNEVISVDTLVAGGTTISADDYFLEPANSGPPYTHVEIDLASSAAFASGSTHQRAIAITGLFGHSNDEEQIGSLSANLAAGASSTASVTWTTADVGVGDVLRVDSERMVVANRTMVDSTQNIGADLTAAANDVTVAVTDGTGFDVDEIILVDSERMLIVDIAGNNLTVKRAWDGSVLAAHTTGADIYALTGVELTRGQLGTTDAEHLSGATIHKHLVPDTVRDLTIAEALNTLLQERSGYARTAGSGESEILVGGRGIADIRREARAAYGRNARSRAV